MHHKHRLKRTWKTALAAWVTTFVLTAKYTGAYSRMRKLAAAENLPESRNTHLKLLALMRVVCVLMVGVRSTIDKVMEMRIDDLDLDEVWEVIVEKERLERDFKLGRDMGLADPQLLDFIIHRVVKREGEYHSYQGSHNLQFRNLRTLIAVRQHFLLEKFAHKHIQVETRLRSLANTDAFRESLVRTAKPLLPRHNLFNDLDRLIRQQIHYDVQTQTSGRLHKKPLLLYHSDIFYDHFSGCTVEDIYFIAQAIMNIKKRVASLLKSIPNHQISQAQSLNELSFVKKIIQEESKKLSLVSENTGMIHAFHYHLTISLEQLRLAKVESKSKNDLKKTIANIHQADKIYLKHLHRLAKNAQILAQAVPEPDSVSTHKLTEDLATKHYNSGYHFMLHSVLRQSVQNAHARFDPSAEAARYGLNKDTFEFSSIKHDLPQCYSAKLNGRGQRISLAIGYVVAYAGMILLNFFGLWGVFNAGAAATLIETIIRNFFALGVTTGSTFLAYYFGTPRILQRFSAVGLFIDREYARHRQNHDKLSAFAYMAADFMKESMLRLFSFQGMVALLLNLVGTPLTITVVKQIFCAVLITHLAVNPVVGATIALAAAVTFAILSGISGIMLNYAQIQGSAGEVSWPELWKNYKDAFSEGRYIAAVAGFIFAVTCVAVAAFTSAAGDWYGLIDNYPTQVIMTTAAAGLSFLGNFSINLKQTLDGLHKSAMQLSYQVDPDTDENVIAKSEKPKRKTHQLWRADPGKCLTNIAFFDRGKSGSASLKSANNDDMRHRIFSASASRRHLHCHRTSSASSSELDCSSLRRL